MTRKITVLRVNEKSLSWRYTAMQEVEAALRKENKKYKNDVVAMETTITERLGYLQRHKVRSLCFIDVTDVIFNLSLCSIFLLHLQLRMFVKVRWSSVRESDALASSVWF